MLNVTFICYNNIMKPKIEILIIEDDTFIAMQLEDTIVNMGHFVVGIVDNAKDAFELAKKKNIDLVISDINIEGELNGIETSKILQELYGLAIIFITAYKDKETLEGVSNLTAAYIVKPFRQEEVEALIEIAILKFSLPKLKQWIKIDKNYTYNMQDKKLFYRDNELSLTKKEELFISLLLSSQHSIVPYEVIDIVLWKEDVVTNDTRRQLIYRFKRKMPDFPIKLIKGKGYTLI